MQDFYHQPDHWNGATNTTYSSRWRNDRTKRGPMSNVLSILANEGQSALVTAQTPRAALLQGGHRKQECQQHSLEEG